MNGRDGEKNWLLIKKRDDASRSAEEGDVLEESSLSVASGRDLPEIAAARDKAWTSKQSGKPKAEPKSPAKETSKKRPTRPSSFDQVSGTKAASMPASLEPQLATLAKDAPEGDQWIHEIKLDGYRMICRVDQGKVSFISRNQQNWTDRLKPLVSVAEALSVEQALLDGEVVAMDEKGVTDFQLLQNAFRDHRASELFYYVFDLLYLDGFDLRKTPLEERKRLLQELLPNSGKSRFRYSEHITGDGPAFFVEAAKHGLEGIISKRKDRGHVAGRGFDWLKVKCGLNDEFVIGGYTAPSGSRIGLGALLLGYHRPDGKLIYAGKVGTGFNQKTLEDLSTRLSALEQTKSPFTVESDAAGPARGAKWVQPQLVAQIAFGNWTRDGMLRHPSFQGLREDKPAKEVVRDQSMTNAAMKKTEVARQSAEGRKGRSKPKPAKASGKQPEEFAGVRLTSPGKVLYPEQGITKLDLAQYYLDVAQWMLPHVANRPLVLVRCPEGRTKECFYQKHPGPGTPKNLRQIPVKEKSKTENYVVVDDAQGLISLVQVGALEIHAWGSHADKIELPNRLIFDLDPDPTVPWSRVVDSARQIRQFLEDLGLETFLKTTGGKGLHLVVPIQRRHEWDEAKAFCKAFSESIVAADSKHYTANMSKTARTGKIFIDYLRNGRGATSIVPYSTRSRPDAPISAPISWDELSTKLQPDEFNVGNIRDRLSALKKDPWEGIDKVRQSLTKEIMKNLGT